MRLFDAWPWFEKHHSCLLCFHPCDKLFSRCALVCGLFPLSIRIRYQYICNDFSLCLSAYKDVLCLTQRIPCNGTIEAIVSFNHRSLVLHFFEYHVQKHTEQKKKKRKQWLFSGGVIGGCERQSCFFSLPSLLHTLRKQQTKIQIQRAGLM